jgi:uroporphyrinogen-III synthase
MKDKTVAILESRMRDHIASLVRKYGGTPFSAPALAEIPNVDPAHIDELIRDWNSAPPDIFIFQTGVGSRALFHCYRFVRAGRCSVTAIGLGAGGRTGPQADHGTALEQGAHRPRCQQPFHDA